MAVRGGADVAGRLLAIPGMRGKLEQVIWRASLARFHPVGQAVRKYGGC
jgi:hypothetical protein